MRTIILLAFGLFCVVSAQVGLPTKASAAMGSSISADGSAPNDNAMLDVKSPSSGAGKGILIPRVSQAQRTTPDGNLPGGLLDNSGNLRGGAAQGLMVYQTDLAEGLYFNTSQTATPAWVYLGISTTNYLPLTGGTMSGVLNMGAQIVSNVAYIDFNGNNVSVGRGANGFSDGAAVGFQANGAVTGVAVGASANGFDNGVAVGVSARGTNYGVAMGGAANGSVYGAAVGDQANGYYIGAAMGYFADGNYYGAAVGWEANGANLGAAVGDQANGTNRGAAMGNIANGYNNGAAMGYQADGFDVGAAVGATSRGETYGAAVGNLAYGHTYGVAMGFYADGYKSGVGVGQAANGANTNVAIGSRANAHGGGQGTQRIAIGNDVTNTVNNTAVIRGTLYLDGGSSNIYCRYPFGTGSWSNKAFEIDHPLDPDNKILRHFCLEGPVVQNVYNGFVKLNAEGEAIVELPAYFEALNAEPQYLLTAVGTSMPGLYVKQEVKDNRFVIGGGVLGGKVCWEIKARRNDPGCLEDLRRRPVEQMKRDLSR